MIDVRDPAAFRASVLESAEPTVVMFGATWCPFSRRFKAEFDRLASSQSGRFASVYLDDEDNPLWEDYAVEVVPTLALFHDGTVVVRLDGILGYGIDKGMMEGFVRQIQSALR